MWTGARVAVAGGPDPSTTSDSSIFDPDVKATTRWIALLFLRSEHLCDAVGQVIVAERKTPDLASWGEQRILVVGVELFSPGGPPGTDAGGAGTIIPTPPRTCQRGTADVRLPGAPCAAQQSPGFKPWGGSTWPNG